MTTPSAARRRGAGNVISGSGVGYGIDIYGATTTANVVEGNFIGTDSTGTTTVDAEGGLPGK